MKRKKIFKFILICGILAAMGLALVLGLNFYVRGTAKPFLTVPETPVDCILVLGCGVREDGTPSLMLRDRLDKGIELYKQGVAPKLLMSGDHSRKDYDEVNVMKDYAIAAGVPSEDIFMDHAGFSTYESMYRARDVFSVRSAVIVSQRYHLFRAVYNARSLGLEAWGVAAEDIAYWGQGMREAREILARAKDFLYCLAKPEPTFLGEVIPIWGNGDLTEG